jgi:hypothetical protein
MSVIAQKIREHRSKIEDRLLSIPEWGVETIVRPMTLDQRSEVFKLVRKDDLKAFVKAICFSCFKKDDRTSPMFDIEDRLVMEKEADTDVILRVGGEIINGAKTDLSSENMGES